MHKYFSRREAIALSSAFALTTALGIEARARTRPAPVTRPNILFIMADDMGYADLSCYGRRDYQTPALDGLAASGVMLDNGYANGPTCSPTRMALITGAYQYRIPAGLEGPLGRDPSIGLSPSVPTMPDLFRQLGYTTSLVGKWHMGTLPGFGPLKSGYDRFFGIMDGGADYFSHRLTMNERSMGGLYEGETPIERQGYLTDLLADRAIEEIEESAKGGRPFFMSLHVTAPHWPWQGPGDKPIDASAMHPTEGGNMATYARMVQSLDQNIGRVLAALEASGLASNTIVVFTSDNGGERFSDVWPFTGFKTDLLEGGIRVPLIVRWPGRIKPGSRSGQVMASMDFLPTLYAAAAGKAPSGITLDGVNLLDVLTGQAPEKLRPLFWRYRERDQQAVRSGDWKYLKVGERESLFNLANDPREQLDVKDRQAEIFGRLKAEFAAWNRDMLPFPERKRAKS